MLLRAVALTASHDQDVTHNMTRRPNQLTLPVLIALLGACSPAMQQSSSTPSPVVTPPARMSPEAALADSLRRAYVEADEHFMTGMIGHHGQALVMARMVPTHGTSPALRALAERIIVGQSDEIALMQRWLADHHLPVADPDKPMSHSMPGMDHSMAGMDHSAMMPGMLTADQLKQLDAARGTAFDRLFLKGMIQHHGGALTMVNQLFASQGAGQAETVFRLASDVYADQSTEIERMQKLLDSLPNASNTP
ncbi:MAG: DUF305 domain-containing protein [Gemmatimonadaceae bacterium]